MRTLTLSFWISSFTFLLMRSAQFTRCSLRILHFTSVEESERKISNRFLSPWCGARRKTWQKKGIFSNWNCLTFIYFAWYHWSSSYLSTWSIMEFFN